MCIRDRLEDVRVVARLHSTECQSRSGGESEREYVPRDVRAEGNQACIPAKLDSALHQLVSETHAGHLVLAGDEYVKHLLLELLGDHYSRLYVRRSAGYGGEARSRSVDELDTTLTHDDVVSGSQPHVIVRRRICFAIEAGLKHVTQRFDYLAGEQ